MASQLSVLMTFMLCLAFYPGSVRPRQTVSLREIGAIEVPAWFRVSGAQILDSLSALVWSAAHPQLLHCSATGCQVVYQDTARILGAFSTSSSERGAVEVVATNPFYIRRVSAGEQRDLLPARPDSSVYAATRLRRGWVIATTGSPEQRQESVSLNYLPLPGVSDQPVEVHLGTRFVHLSSTGDSAAIAQEVYHPFRAWTIVVGGGRAASRQQSLDLSTIGPIDTVSFVALPRLSVENGALLTLADLRSDARILIHLDTSGRLLSSVHIEAPVGFISSRPDLKTILAVRNRGADEIVFYRYAISRS